MKRKLTALTLMTVLVCAIALTACTSPAPAENPSATTTAANNASSAQPEEVTEAAPAGAVIKIATKPMTEQFILGEMLKLIIEENTDYTVDITKGIGGGTSNIQPAMEKGEFDMYPEYTGTGWEFVLKHEGGSLPDDELFAQLQQEYAEQFGFEWVGKYGFGDQYGLAVKKEIAETNNLETYSDLAALSPDLIFAAEPDFYERDDGYDAMCETYGYDFKSTKDIDIGLKYPAINAGEVDVMDIFTTDGQLAVADVKVLEDDQDFFATQYCYTVVRQDALEQFTGLRDALMKMEGIINEEEMTQMNYAVDVEKKEDAEVAREFLQSKGIIS